LLYCLILSKIGKKGGEQLLTALTESKELFNTLNYTRLQLKSHLTNNAQFYCPHCKSPMQLKIGYQKVPHFAHISTKTCSFNKQSESIQHLTSKKLLYDLLKSSHDQVYLEYYFSSVKQIADIWLETETESIAIELQCSSIPVSEVRRRTKGYLSSRVQPLWILVQPIDYTLPLSLTPFQQSFIRYSSKLGYFLLQLSPEKRQFNVYTHLVPVSLTKFISNKTILPLTEFSFPIILSQVNQTTSLTTEDWWRYRKKWIANKIGFNGRRKDLFLKEVYNDGDIFQYLPAYIGLPVPHMILVKNHPIQWQYYIWKDILKGKVIRSNIKLQEVVAALKKRVKKNNLVLRDFPFIPIHQYDLTYIVQQYLFLLENLGILVEVQQNIFQLIQPWQTFKTFGEVERYNDELFLKWKHILNRTKLQEKSF
jgi:competence protein CoiA